MDKMRLEYVIGWEVCHNACQKYLVEDVVSVQD